MVIDSEVVSFDGFLGIVPVASVDCPSCLREHKIDIPMEPGQVETLCECGARLALCVMRATVSPEDQRVSYQIRQFVVPRPGN